MHRFVDEIDIRIKAGNGGAGCVSFRHEKYLEFGGPDGGDGGDGGSIYMLADERVLTLSHLRSNKLYKAGNGLPGMGRQCSGKKGEDLTLKVPYGTQLINPQNLEIVHDFTDAKPILLTEGARGGKGNTFFKSSTHQAPRFAQPGESTEEINFKLSLKLIADVGFVGFPNAGKSTLLKALTQANPKIGAYPFTTLSPNLGVLKDDIGNQIFVADIPGILEGANKGYGLGISFLKHIERVKAIVFVLDLETSHVEEELETLRKELSGYNPSLLEREYIVVLNKVDKINDRDFLGEWIQSFHGKNIEPIVTSAVTKEGIDLLKAKILSIFLGKTSPV